MPRELNPSLFPELQTNSTETFGATQWPTPAHQQTSARSPMKSDPTPFAPQGMAQRSPLGAEQPIHHPHHLPNQLRGAEPRGFQVSEEQWNLVVTQLEYLRKKTKEQENEIKSIEARMKDLAVAVKSKVERLASLSQNFETIFKNFKSEAQERFAQLSSKVSERKLKDEQVDSLVERQNRVVQGFEQRLSQLQKLVSEQEMQLLNARSAIQEAQRQFLRRR